MDKEINNWLQKFEIVNQIAETIHSEKLEDDIKNLALQRTGWEPLPAKYIHEYGWRRRYQYMLLLKSESESDKQRLENNDWLDELSNTLANAQKEGNLPNLKEGKCYGVDCANAMTYEESEDGAQSVYALQIYFNVKGGEKA